MRTLVFFVFALICASARADTPDLPRKWLQAVRDGDRAAAANLQSASFFTNLSITPRWDTLTLHAGTAAEVRGGVLDKALAKRFVDLGDAITVAHLRRETSRTSHESVDYYFATRGDHVDAVITSLTAVHN